MFVPLTITNDAQLVEFVMVLFAWVLLSDKFCSYDGRRRCNVSAGTYRYMKQLTNTVSLHWMIDCFEALVLITTRVTSYLIFGSIDKIQNDKNLKCS